MFAAAVAVVEVIVVAVGAVVAVVVAVVAANNQQLAEKASMQFKLSINRWQCSGQTKAMT